MTNAEWIRQMLDDDLARVIDNSIDYFSCDDCKKPTHGRNCEGVCLEWIKVWLGDERES